MEEAHEIQQLISAVVESEGKGVDQHFNRYKSIVSHIRHIINGSRDASGSTEAYSQPAGVLQLTKYQEQPQLLDGSLEAIVQPLAVLLRQTAESSTAHDTALVQGVCRMLHVLISVRGYKTVVRFFPHEAADLERVLQVCCRRFHSRSMHQLNNLLLHATVHQQTPLEACSNMQQLVRQGSNL